MSSLLWCIHCRIADCYTSIALLMKLVFFLVDIKVWWIMLPPIQNSRVGYAPPPYPVPLPCLLCSHMCASDNTFISSSSYLERYILFF